MYEYIKDKHLLIHPKEDIIGVGDNLWAIDPYSREHSGIHNDEQIVDNGLNPKELFNMMPIIVPENELFIMGDNWGHNRKRKLLYGRSHLSSKSSKILNVKNPRFLHSI